MKVFLSSFVDHTLGCCCSYIFFCMVVDSFIFTWRNVQTGFSNLEVHYRDLLDINQFIMNKFVTYDLGLFATEKDRILPQF